MKKSREITHYNESRRAFERIALPITLVIDLVIALIAIFLVYKATMIALDAASIHNVAPLLLVGTWASVTALETCDIRYYLDEIRKRVL